MPKKTKTIKMPLMIREASFKPATVSKEARTAEIVWTTGARVMRWDFI